MIVARLRGQLGPRRVLVDLEVRADRVEDLVEEGALRCSHGSIAPSLSDSSSFGTIRSGSKNILAPMPSQVGQAPCGLLNENSRGVISG